MTGGLPKGPGVNSASEGRSKRLGPPRNAVQKRSRFGIHRDVPFPSCQPQFESKGRSQFSIPRPGCPFFPCFVCVAWFESQSFWNGFLRVVSNSPSFQAARSTSILSRRRCSGGVCVGHTLQRLLVVSIAWMASSQFWVRCTQFVDASLEGGLFLAPRAGLFVVERRGDSAVELVEVHGLDPGIEAVVFCLGVLQGLFAGFGLVHVRLAEGGA